MKKRILKSLLLFVVLIATGCDDSFNPKGEFEDGYSLFCIVDGNSSIQKAYLTKNYNPQGLNPDEYSRDKSIVGADLYLYNSDTVYTFFDTTLIGDDGKSYNAYYLKDFISTDDVWEIEVAMPDGSKLNSEVKAPGNLRFSYETIKGIVYDPVGVYRIAFYDKQEAFYFNPKLFINYSLKVGTEFVHYRIEVPRRYYEFDNTVMEDYPNPGLRTDYEYPIASIEKTLLKIADVVPKGSEVYVKNLTLEVLELSDEFAFYYEINKTFNDGFTVKSQQPAYTNITGGNGLFGYKFTSKLEVSFNINWRDPIKDMGYILEQ